MARATPAHTTLPGGARRALATLAGDLRQARSRRGWSLREAAQRMFITVTTLRRLEAGHPGVSLGVLAHALFLYGLVDRLAQVANPAFDMMSLAQERARVRPGRRADFDV